jgi:hypothetical protein
MTTVGILVLTVSAVCFIIGLLHMRRGCNREVDNDLLADVRARANGRRAMLDTEHEKRLLSYYQAENDIRFYSERVETLERLILNAQETLNNAQAVIEDDNEKNQYGQAVSIATVNKHIRELNRAEKDIMALETQLHNAHKNIEKAKFTLTH